MDERLRHVPLFAELDDDDLARVCQGVQATPLPAGQELFHEGDPGDTAYVVVAGQVEIVKSVGQRETLLAVRGEGDVIGEMALLQETPRIATVRARSDAELLTIPKSVLDALFETSPGAIRSMFSTLLERLRDTEERRRQTDRMAQLGTLTAGVAHELNNPAAGAGRAAERLDDALQSLAALLPEAGASDRDVLERVVTAAQASQPARLDGMARSDEESDVEEWLDDHDVADSWKLAPVLVDAGIRVDTLDDVAGGLDDEGVGHAVRLLAALALPRRLAHDVADGARRISDIVSRLKSHAYLDRAPVQQVDLHADLDDTIALLGHKLRDIAVVREYGDDVPAVTGAGSELNQVWTNLLDNAAYAVDPASHTAPQIVVRTRRLGSDVVVEVEDNGAGISDEIKDRIFDAFFTTKPPGAGTGLGLNLSYQIVVLDHSGELTATSTPGRTTFRVVLPIEGPEAAKKNA